MYDSELPADTVVCKRAAFTVFAAASRLGLFETGCISGEVSLKHFLKLQTPTQILVLFMGPKFAASQMCR